jgi:hypothetical protein
MLTIYIMRKKPQYGLLLLTSRGRIFVALAVVRVVAEAEVNLGRMG